MGVEKGGVGVDRPQNADCVAKDGVRAGGCGLELANNAAFIGRIKRKQRKRINAWQRLRR